MQPRWSTYLGRSNAKWNHTDGLVQHRETFQDDRRDTGLMVQYLTCQEIYVGLVTHGHSRNVLYAANVLRLFSNQ